MSTTTTARTFQLGGQTQSRSVLGGGLTFKRMLFLAPLAVFALVLLLVSRTVWTLLGEAVAVLVVLVLLRRRDDHGQASVFGWRESLRTRMEARVGTNVYDPDPQVDPRPLPVEVGALRVMAYAAPATPAAPLAIVEQSVNGGETYQSVTLEIAGSGGGLREQTYWNAESSAFGRFLYAMSVPEMPVDQVDIATRVLPLDVGEYRQWLGEHLSPTAPARLRDSVWELAEEVQWSGEQYRTFLTVSMPKAALAARAFRRRGEGAMLTQEQIAAAAFEVTGEVIRQAEASGLTVRAAFGPRRLAALIRHTYDPGFGLDDQQGLRGVPDGFQPYRNVHAHYLSAGVMGQPWCHAVASVPRDAWPMTPVGTRWLEALVTNITPATIRTVNAQFRLTPKAKARALAYGAHVIDEANRRGKAKKGQLSTGEEEAQSSASRLLLNDLLHLRAAGCQPALRVLVSAQSPQELAMVRDRVETAAQDANIARLDWHDTRHHHAMLLALPLGRGIAR